MKKLSLWNRMRIVWFSLVALFLLWQASTYQSRGIDKNLMEDEGRITVERTKDRISFILDNDSPLEVIFFPGGLVDPQAYVPLARNLAEAGYTIHIIQMPWRMSTRGYTKIMKLFDLQEGGKRYILGGHSQGAKMAAQFVYENEGLVEGLFLLASSHPRDIDLSHLDVPCIKIYGEFDGLASVEEVEANKDKLPKNSQFVRIDGANHSQFGYMGRLFMDGKATLSREEQHRQTVQLLTTFLQGIN